MNSVQQTFIPSNAWARGLGVYALFAVIAIIATFPTGADMAHIWIGSSSYHHGLFVIPAAIWMIVSFGPRPAAGGYSIGLLIILAGIAAWLFGHAASTAIIEQGALVVMLIGGVGVVFGDKALIAWAWPLAFLFFMVPSGESLVPALQVVTAKIIVAALNVLGFNVVIEGIVIDTSVGAFAIAEACAGLNLLVAALMVSAIFAYSAFKTWPHRIAFLLFAALFAIFANALRAFLLILIAILTGKHTGVGLDHYFIGWVLYLGVLIVLALVGRRFASRRVQPPHAGPAPALRAKPLALALILIVAGGVYAHKLIDKPIDRTAPTTLSLLNAPGWRILPPPDNWRPAAPDADRAAAATYDSEGARVYVNIAYVTHDRRGAEIASGFDHAEDGWRLTGDHQAVVYVFGSSTKQRFEKMSGPGNRRLLTLTAYWLGDDIYYDSKALKLAQAKQKMRGRNPDGGAIIFAASYGDNPAEAVKLIGRFTSDVETFLSWRARLNGE